ncbi:unnamed protein product [Closterium sp. Yama58-4]|nr:unnamed protein product [Closterium sp. Yama58-4]
MLLMQLGGEVIYAGLLGRQSCDLIHYFKATRGATHPAGFQPCSMDARGHGTRSSREARSRLCPPVPPIRAVQVPSLAHPRMQCASQRRFGHYLHNAAPRNTALPIHNEPVEAPPHVLAHARLQRRSPLLLHHGSPHRRRLLWLRPHSRHPQQIANVTGALYTAALFLGWSNLATIQPMLAVERSIYYRERGAGMYAAIPYALAQGVIELPYLAVQAGTYASITYLLIRFEWTPGKFLWYLLFQLLTLLYFTCFGMMASAITPAEGLGTLLSAFVYSFWNLLCGFLLPQPVSVMLIGL